MRHSPDTVIAGPAVIVLVVMAVPAGAASPESQKICDRLLEISAALAKDLPLKLDEFTTQTKIEAVCDTKKFSFQKKANGTSSDFPDGWQGLLQERWGYLMCSKDAFSKAIETGWEVSETIAFDDGTRHRSVAICK